MAKIVKLRNSQYLHISSLILPIYEYGLSVSYSITKNNEYEIIPYTEMLAGIRTIDNYVTSLGNGQFKILKDGLYELHVTGYINPAGGSGLKYLSTFKNNSMIRNVWRINAEKGVRQPMGLTHIVGCSAGDIIDIRYRGSINDSIWKDDFLFIRYIGGIELRI